MTSPVEKFIVDNGVAISVLLFLAWFLAGKLWPFITTQMWPAYLKQAEARMKNEAEQTSALIRLETSQQMVVRLLERQLEMFWNLAAALAGIKTDHIPPKPNEEVKQHVDQSP